MLAAKYRLAKKKDIGYLFKHGKKIFSHFFIINYLPNSLKNCRITVVIANKITKKATARNQIKRKLREILRLNLSNFRENYDIIIVLRSPLNDFKYQEIQDLLLAEFKKNNLMK